ncbi:MAG: hypothetical protein JSR82_05750 [Verrucomicrobia bacterium]|nr:hypothetical protein [Verrucomicrobiota bacterium]
MDTNYVEECIAALPSPKREAAREAFREILGEGGDGHLLSRLLIVFEATAAYGRQLPTELGLVMERGLAALDSRLQETARSKTMADGALLPPDCVEDGERITPEQLTSLFRAQGVEIGRVAAAVERFRHARVTSFLGFMLASFLAGCGIVAGAFYQDFENAKSYRRYWRALESRGVGTAIAVEGKAFVLRVEGPTTTGAVWKRNAGGAVVGVELQFPEP